MRKIIVALSVMLFTSSIVAQKTINNYKYVIVPNQFEFQKSTDQYQVNSLLKFLFNRAGMEAYLTSDEKPTDLVNNNCSALSTKLIEESSMFKTKLKVQLLDCYNKLIFETKLGSSKEKEFKKAYHESARRAFVDIENLNYKYEPSLMESSKTQIKEIKHEPKKEVISKEITDTKHEPIVEKKSKKMLLVSSLEGNYNFSKWGKSTITKTNNGNYSVIGGDENFNFATIYKTSKPTLFIIKWITNKQPQLLEIDKNGNLNVDSNNGIQIYNKLN